MWNAMKAADQLHPLYRWFALVLSGIAMLLVVVATVLLYLWFAIGLWCWLAFEIYVRLKR